MKRRTWMLLGGAIILLALIGIILARRGVNAPLVDVERVVRRPVFRSTVTASGEIVATRFADIGSSVMGRLVKLMVAEGDAVKAGQVLARIDPVPARSDAAAAAAGVRALEAEEQAARQQVQAARAERETARARAQEAARALERAKALRAEGLTTGAEFDAAQAGADAALSQETASVAVISRAEQSLNAATRRIAQARAQADRANDMLSKTEIAAPIDGIVSRLQVREGEMVVIGIQNQPGTTLMTISDLGAINAEVKVAEADVLRIATGQSARVTLEAVRGKEFTGRVVEVGASALPVVGTGAAAREFRVVVRLDRPDPGLRPGLTCDAEILTSERKDALTVPLQAVVLRPDGGGRERTGVFVLRNGKAEFAPVDTGVIGGLDMEVRGVAEATPVIVGPFQVLRELQNGSPVRENRPRN
jgi:HlyD family secretion protein